MKWLLVDSSTLNWLPVLIDTVATLPLYVRETRRLSRDHKDAIDAKWFHEDAIAATTSR
jgi:hypothetical protein